MLGLWNPVIGHFSDKYGRKRVIYIALVVYCLGAAGSAWAPTIAWLNVARCVQGCGEAVSVITTAVIRDVVSGPALCTTAAPHHTHTHTDSHTRLLLLCRWMTWTSA